MTQTQGREIVQSATPDVIRGYAFNDTERGLLGMVLRGWCDHSQWLADPRSGSPSPAAGLLLATGDMPDVLEKLRRMADVINPEGKRE